MICKDCITHAYCKLKSACSPYSESTQNDGTAELNPQLLDCQSDALTTTPPSHTCLSFSPWTLKLSAIVQQQKQIGLCQYVSTCDTNVQLHSLAANEYMYSVCCQYALMLDKNLQTTTILCDYSKQIHILLEQNCLISKIFKK